ncbi:glycoside hydrolase family 43 protein [Marinilabilia salmonicolor]|uniref:beta-xylosidase family glycoside hydrolase n=1 Tax=Marinilabilia salmonicolor TaxID=989 RepID=UPI000AC24451|nr:glycoside hydrolase family 43 protein [Marinilabilia salmonicolor]
MNSTFEYFPGVPVFLSTQTVGWFTGVYVGLYATGNGESSEVPAVYDWFEYAAIRD